MNAQIVNLQERRHASRRQARIAQASTSLEDANKLLADLHELCALVEEAPERRQILAAMLNLQEAMCVLRRVAHD